MFKCMLCAGEWAYRGPNELLDHMRLFHPEADWATPRYPDGDVVVEDDCPEYMVGGRAPNLVDVTM